MNTKLSRDLGRAERKEEDKKGLGRFRPEVKRMFLNLGSADGSCETALSEPNQDFKKILESTSTADAYVQVMEYLENEGVSGHISPGVVTGIFNGRLQTPKEAKSLGFSVFSCSLLSYDIVKLQDRIMSMHIHSTDGQGILEKDADLLTELKMYIPIDCNMFKNQIKIFAAVLKLITDENAYAYRKTKEWVEIIEQNEAAYMEAQKSNKLFFTCILWIIHSRLQMYIRNCRMKTSGDLNPEDINFDNMRRYLLVEGCSAILPEVIQKELKSSEKRKRRLVLDGDQDGPEDDKSKRPRNNKGDPVFLADHLVQNSLLLREKENFGDLAGAIRKFPECVPVTSDGEQICMRIIGTKKCHSKCSFAKWHNKPLTSGMVETGKKLMGKMRA